jgi:phenylacetate-CoA ligase
MNFHDTRETRDPEARERELLARLPAQIAHARAAAPARWGGCSPTSIRIR